MVSGRRWRAPKGHWPAWAAAETDLLLRPPVAPADTHHHLRAADVCASWEVGLLPHYHHRTPPLFTVETPYGNLSGSLCKHCFLIQQNSYFHRSCLNQNEVQVPEG